jgi:biotin synthase
MGESDDDIIDLAVSLRDLKVERERACKLSHTLAGTPLAGVNSLTPRKCLRVLCLFRFILPSRKIRVVGGREVHLRSLQPLGLYPANSLFIGDYLTTAEQSARADLEMIRDAGFVLEMADGSEFEGDPLAELDPDLSYGARRLCCDGGRVEQCLTA